NRWKGYRWLAKNRGDDAERVPELIKAAYFGGKLKRDCFAAMPRGRRWRLRRRRLRGFGVSMGATQSTHSILFVGPSAPLRRDLPARAPRQSRLIASSYLVGAGTGRSARFSPLRMRSTGQL